MSRTDRLALPHLATRSLPLHLSSLSAASFARSSYDRCLCQGALLRSRVRSLLPFSQHVRMCCTHTCIYQTGWRVTRCSFLICMNHEVAEKAHAGGLGLRISAYTMQFLTTVPVPGASERWIIHERVVPRLIGARILRVRTREGYFATVPPVVVGSSSRMGIIAARHPGKFKDMTVSPAAQLRPTRLIS